MQLSSTNIVNQTNIILLFAQNDFCTIFRKFTLFYFGNF